MLTRREAGTAYMTVCSGGSSFQHGGRLVHKIGCSLLLNTQDFPAFLEIRCGQELVISYEM